MIKPCETCTEGDSLQELGSSILNLVNILQQKAEGTWDAALGIATFVPNLTSDELATLTPGEIAEIDQKNEEVVRVTAHLGRVSGEVIEFIKTNFASADAINCQLPVNSATGCPKLDAIVAFQPRLLDTLAQRHEPDL